MCMVSIKILVPIVPGRRKLVKSDFTSKLAMIRLGSNYSISLANENDSFIVYSLVVIAFSNVSQNMPIADKIARKVESPSSKDLCILPSP